MLTYLSVLHSSNLEWLHLRILQLGLWQMELIFFLAISDVLWIWTSNKKEKNMFRMCFGVCIIFLFYSTTNTGHAHKHKTCPELFCMSSRWSQRCKSEKSSLDEFILRHHGCLMRATEFYRVRTFQDVKKSMAAYKEPKVSAKCFLLKEKPGKSPAQC